LWRCIPLLCIAILALALDNRGELEVLGFVALSCYGVVRWALWRLRQGPIKAHLVVLACLVAGWLGFGSVMATIGVDLYPRNRHAYGRIALGAVLLGFGCAVLPDLIALMRRHVLTLSIRSEAPSTSAPSRWSPALVVLGTLAAHGTMFFGLEGPVLQPDSFASVWHAGLLNFTDPPHHPPIYIELVRIAAPTTGNWLGLTALVLFQHCLVLAVAVGMERAARLMTGRAWVGCLVGLLVGVDATWNLYAQSIMSEVMSSALCMFSALCLLEAERRKGAVRWLIAAGLLAGFATLTRQAMQAWFGVGLIWLTLFSALRPRRLACLVLFLASVLPVGTWMLRNYVALERGIVTASLGRNLLYRVVLEMPDLTDPDAPPGDEMEKAREIVWRERARVWVGPWNALRAELGWSDARINQVVVRFYTEQIKRHPGIFAEVTWRSFQDLATGREAFGGTVFPFHNRAIEESPWAGAPTMPVGGGVPPPLALLECFQLSASPFWLFLAFASPLLAWGAGRRASFLALGGFTYFCLLASLVEVPVVRYRLPGVPLLYLAGCLSLAGIARWIEIGGRKVLGQNEGSAKGEVEEPGEDGAPFLAQTRPEAAESRLSISAPLEAQQQRYLSGAAVALASLPGLLGAASGAARSATFLLALAAEVALAVIVVRLRAGVRTRLEPLDTAAWLGACLSTTLILLLSSPQPYWLGPSAPERRITLAILGLVAGLSVGVFLFLPARVAALAEESPAEEPAVEEPAVEEPAVEESAGDVVLEPPVESED
jgi:hypothetical protein